MSTGNRIVPLAQELTQDPPEYVWIPPGTFSMGAVPQDYKAPGPEKPQHPVTITKGSWLRRTPVTVKAYRSFAQETGRSMPWKLTWWKKDHPITKVTWEEANAYCQWVGGRLPTSAEWEYAARAGKYCLKYPWGDSISSKDARYDTLTLAHAALISGLILLPCKFKGTSAVGSYPPNGFGLYDMAGNVWEWVSDWYDRKYYSTLSLNEPTEDPRGPDRKAGDRMLRGGSWFVDATMLRCSFRGNDKPSDKSFDIGFRCVRETMPV